MTAALYSIRLPLLAALLLVFPLSLSVGCVGSQLSAIEASDLSEQDKAAAKLFSAEGAWVEAKEILANVLTELAFSGVALSPDVKARLRQGIDGGNLAMSSARMALARGDYAAGLASALRTLQAATRALTSEAVGLAATPEAP